MNSCTHCTLACRGFSGRAPGLWRRASRTAGGACARAGTRGQVPAAAPTPTFRTTVDLVSSDVIVRNRRGQFQADLSKDDFELYEDGVKQELTSFVLVHGGRAYTTTQVRHGDARPRRHHSAAVAPDERRGRPHHHVRRRRSPSRVPRHAPRPPAVREMGKELIHEGDLFGDRVDRARRLLPSISPTTARAWTRRPTGLRAAG